MASKPETWEGVIADALSNTARDGDLRAALARIDRILEDNPQASDSDVIRFDDGLLFGPLRRVREALAPPPAQDQVPALGLPAGEVEGLRAFRAKLDELVEASDQYAVERENDQRSGACLAADQRRDAAYRSVMAIAQPAAVRTRVLAPPTSAAVGEGREQQADRLCCEQAHKWMIATEVGPYEAYARAKLIYEVHASAYVEKYVLTASPPVPPSRVAGLDRNDLTEELAKHLHDEHDEHTGGGGENHVWPDHEDDDGYRGNGYVRIAPKSIQQRRREAAARILRFLDRPRFRSLLAPTPGETPGQDAVEALAALALDVCEGIENQDGPLPEDSPAGLLRSGARTALASLRSTQADTGGDGWQPIETAPKDGTWILGWQAEAVAYGGKPANVVRWSDKCWTIWRYEGAREPTHWMPLPPAPTPLATDGEPS